MRSANPLPDPVEQARADYFRVRYRCAALEAELGALVLAVPADTMPREDGGRARRLRERVARAGRARDAAYAAFGRALLKQFAADVSALAENTRQLWRSGDAAVLRDATCLEDGFRRSCLKVLERWPELREEAERRLTSPAASDQRILH
jgi:hypothetical protein